MHLNINVSNGLKEIGNIYIQTQVSLSITQLRFLLNDIADFSIFDFTF